MDSWMPWALVVEQLGLGLFAEDIQALVGLHLFLILLESLVLASLMASLGLK